MMNTSRISGSIALAAAAGLAAACSGGADAPTESTEAGADREFKPSQPMLMRKRNATAFRSPVRTTVLQGPVQAALAPASLITKATHGNMSMPALAQTWKPQKAQVRLNQSPPNSV